MNDRMIDDVFEVTHDAIALMLGVRRASITHAIEELGACGAIERGRGHVRILDRAILEQRTCSCYPDARDLFTELYGFKVNGSEISKRRRSPMSCALDPILIGSRALSPQVGEAVSSEPDLKNLHG